MSGLYRRRVRQRRVGAELPVILEPMAVRGQVPRHDLNAEASVLSPILTTGRSPSGEPMGGRIALDQVKGFLQPQHFYSEANERIFMAMLALDDAGEPIDLTTVVSWLREREWLAGVGGPGYLISIADATPAAEHIRSHAKTVYDRWRIRQVQARSQMAAAEAYGDVGNVQDWIERNAEALFELTRGHAERREPNSAAVLAKRMLEGLAERERTGRRRGISTGYDRLDSKIVGLEDGCLYVVAARPGMGKTALVTNVGVHVATPQEEPMAERNGVMVFSLEMPEEQLFSRMTCTEARVDLGRFRNDYLQPDDWRRFAQASDHLASLPIWIDDTPAIGLSEVRSKVRRKQAEFNRPTKGANPAQRVGLVVVDYLQLMRGRGDEGNREQEIAGLSRGLKELAKELRVPVIALSQLNRSVETRSVKDKRPGLADLRESGAIEQDADTIIFIYRDEYYYPETSNAKGIAELIISKQRNGPTGKVLVRFQASCTRFDNLAPGDYPDMEDE